MTDKTLEEILKDYRNFINKTGFGGSEKAARNMAIERLESWAKDYAREARVEELYLLADLPRDSLEAPLLQRISDHIAQRLDELDKGQVSNGVTSKVRMVGNSHAVLLPKSYVDSLGLKTGDKVSITVKALSPKEGDSK